jgi:hypothetical protein
MAFYDLHFYEEIMLLALKDEEGTIPFGTMYNYAVSGAFVAELLLADRIQVDQSNKKKLIKPVNQRKFGDPLLDECLETIFEAKKERKLQTWISKFAEMSKLKHRTASQLCKRGILRCKEKDVLLIFKKKVYPEINPDPERKLIRRLEEAIFSDKENLDMHTVVIISLAHHTGLLEVNFDKKRLKERKKRIGKITNGEIVGNVTGEAIQAMQAAITAATTAATIAATAASTS